MAGVLTTRASTIEGVERVEPSLEDVFVHLVDAERQRVGG